MAAQPLSRLVSSEESVGEQVKEVVSDTEKLIKARLRLAKAQMEAAGPEVNKIATLGATANVVITAGTVVLLIALARGAEATMAVSYPLVLLVMGAVALGTGVYFLKSAQKKMCTLRSLISLSLDESCGDYDGKK